MQKKSGFTLMELMVVIAIISILSALAVPNLIKWRPKRQLSAATKEILSVMQYARSRALKENTRVGLLFDRANETYTVFFDNGAGANANNGTQDGDEPTVKSGRMPPGIDLKDTTLAADEVFFDSRGLLSNAGGVVNLENSLNVTKSISVIRTGNSRIL
jgi:type IV fimbrial biogenesis protein FimT